MSVCELKLCFICDVVSVLHTVYILWSVDKGCGQVMRRLLFLRMTQDACEIYYKCIAFRSLVTKGHLWIFGCIIVQNIRLYTHFYNSTHTIRVIKSGIVFYWKFVFAIKKVFIQFWSNLVYMTHSTRICTNCYADNGDKMWHNFVDLLKLWWLQCNKYYLLRILRMNPFCLHDQKGTF